MTWKEFKNVIEDAGVEDDMVIVSISMIGSDDKDLGLFIDDDSFSVYGKSEHDT